MIADDTETLLLSPMRVASLPPLSRAKSRQILQGSESNAPIAQASASSMKRFISRVTSGGMLSYWKRRAASDSSLAIDICVSLRPTHPVSFPDASCNHSCPPERPMTRTGFCYRGLLAALAIGILNHAVCADEGEGFYTGRKLAVVIGHEVGTGFDLYGRALARHMGRFIPGNPTLVPENMVGVAGFAAANWLYNVAAKDGSVIAIFAHTAPFEPLLGKGTARFDASKFTWIGNMDGVVGVCGVWDHAGISKFDDLFTKETVFGAGGAGTGGPLTQFPTAVKRLLGAKIKLIQGYKGSAEIRLAMARGELQGICGLPMSTVKTEWRDDFNSGRFKIILQLGRDRSPELP